MHPLPLLQILADGHFHSGAEIGEALGVTRAAVWKAVRQLESYAVDVHSVKGKGYRLSEPLVLLDRQAIFDELEVSARSRLKALEVLFSVDSTNAWLLEQVRRQHSWLEAEGFAVCLAEMQQAGRGRRGRTWVSPLGHNLYFTMAQHFQGGALGLEGLSLVVGIAVVEALAGLGIRGLALKWPNDILCQGSKVAGILLEMNGDVSGECQVIIGVGLNIRCQVETMGAVEQAWTDLSRHYSHLPCRNRIAAALINSLVGHLDRFRSRGFTEFMPAWQMLDATHGKAVNVLTGSGATPVAGTAAGVTEQGALRIMSNAGEELVFNGGEVSLRIQMTDDR